MHQTFVLREVTHMHRLAAFLRANWLACARAGKPLAVTVAEHKAKRSVAAIGSPTNGGAIGHANRLREELAAAQKDAERYRWLTGAPPHSVRWQRIRLEWFNSQTGWNPMVGLDATIDAAMAKEKRDE